LHPGASYSALGYYLEEGGTGGVAAVDMFLIPYLTVITPLITIGFLPQCLKPIAVLKPYRVEIEREIEPSTLYPVWVGFYV